MFISRALMYIPHTLYVIPHTFLMATLCHLRALAKALLAKLEPAKMPWSPEPTAPPAVPTPAEAAAPAVSAPSPKSTAAPLQPAAGDGAAVKEAGAPADDHEEAGAAEEGAAEEGAAAGTAATAAAPAAPTVQAVSPSPPKLDGAPAALPEEGTVDRGEQAEERAAERGKPAGAFVDLAAGVEGGAIDSLAPVQGSGPAEAEADAAAAGEDRAPITVAPTGIRASENPADHSVCQGC